MRQLLRAIVSVYCAGAACIVTGCGTPVAPTTEAACPAACARRAELGCIEPGLALTCLPVCLRAAERGLFDALCAARAASVSEMQTCHVRCAR